jgi:hypothetical protein
MTNTKPAFKYNGYIVSAKDAPLYVEYMEYIINNFNHKCVMGVCPIDLKFEYIEDALIELSYEECDEFICEMGLRNALKLCEDCGFDEIPMSEMKELDGIRKFMFCIMFSCIEINDGITMVCGESESEESDSESESEESEESEGKCNCGRNEEEGSIGCSRYPSCCEDEELWGDI